MDIFGAFSLAKSPSSEIRIWTLEGEQLMLPRKYLSSLVLKVRTYNVERENYS